MVIFGRKVNEVLYIVINKIVLTEIEKMAKIETLFQHGESLQTITSQVSANSR